MISDRERHQHDESRGHDDCPYEPALHRPRAPIDRYAWRTDRFKAPPGIRLTDTLQSHFAAISVCVRLRRSRISLPVLKNGTDFWSTATCAPVLGLRPARARRFLTEKAPKPRNSTRSPRASAATISPRIALTIFSTSRW